MSKLIIHIGMPKTGSSSIQETLFSKGQHYSYRYADLGVLNHGGVITSFFSKDPYAWHGHKAVGRNRDQVNAFNEQVRKKLDLIKSSKGDQIISGEDIYQQMDEYSLRGMRDYFSDAFEKVEVIGYVRPPASFMASAFTQLVKNHGQSKLDLEKVWPRYRSKLEKFDRVFGQESVTLKKFVPENLVDGDVVQDFCHFLGAPIAKPDIRRVNESLSLEATAALCVYRKYGPCYLTRPELPADNNHLIKILAGFGSRKLRFSNSLVDLVIEKNQSDLDWIEARLGEPLCDKLGAHEYSITCEEDLVEVARQSVDELEVFVRKCLRKSAPTPQQVAKWMERLRIALTGRASNGAIPIPCEESAFFSTDQIALLANSDTGPAVALRELALSFDRIGRRKEACNCIEAALTLRPDAKGLHSLHRRFCSDQ